VRCASPISRPARSTTITAGQESNWIPTTNGKPFFVMFRIYGPEKGVVDGSRVLDDIEEIR
jgi:hypothetical protein